MKRRDFLKALTMTIPSFIILQQIERPKETLKLDQSDTNIGIGSNVPTAMLCVTVGGEKETFYIPMY